MQPKQKNKKTAILLQLSLLLALLTPTPALAETAYPDVPTTHWSQQALSTLAQKYQLKLGFPDGRFQGDQALTRYQMAALLAQVLEQTSGKLAGRDLTTLKKLVLEYKQELVNLKQEHAQRIEAIEQRLEDLTDQVDIQDQMLTNTQRDIQIFGEQFGFRVFGSLAIRFCGMATAIFSEPQNAFGSNSLGHNFQARFSGGLMGKMTDNFNYQIRFLTNDNNSFNLSWYPSGGNHIPRAILTMDRFFIAYKPMPENAQVFLNFTMGKAENFFGESELLFDEDVSFTGTTEQITVKNLMPWWKNISLGLAQNALLVESTFITTSLLGAKLSTEFAPLEQLGIKLGGSYLHYIGASNLAKYNFGQGYQGDYSLRNTGAEQGRFDTDFRIVDAFAKVNVNWHERFPVRIFGDYVHNLGATTQNQGFSAGVQVGQLKHPGDLLFNYIYKMHPRDYNLSLVVDENMAGTDVYGHQIDLGVQLTPKANATLTMHVRNSLSQPNLNTLYIVYLGLRHDL